MNYTLTLNPQSDCNCYLCISFCFPFLLFSAHCSCRSPGGKQTMPATIQSTITNMNFWKRQQSRCFPPTLFSSTFPLLPPSFILAPLVPHVVWLEALGCSLRAFWLHFACPRQGSSKGSSKRSCWRGGEEGHWSAQLMSSFQAGGGRGRVRELDELAVPVLLPLRLPFPYSFRIFSGQQLRWLWSAAKGATQTATLPQCGNSLSLSVSELSYSQCQLTKIYTEIQQMPHRAEPSPRRESLTHLPFGSARAELKFMESFWVSGCRGQTCACTFPARHNMWHIPRQAGGASSSTWGIPTSEGRSFNLLTSGFFGPPFCCRVEFKQ